MEWTNLGEWSQGLVTALGRAHHDKRLDMHFVGDKKLPSWETALKVVEEEIKRRGADPDYPISLRRR